MANESPTTGGPDLYTPEAEEFYASWGPDLNAMRTPDNEITLPDGSIGWPTVEVEGDRTLVLLAAGSTVIMDNDDLAELEQ